MSTQPIYQNGGWVRYPDRVTKRTFFRADDRFTATVTVKAGQVLKQHSFVESIQGSSDVGKVIGHKGLYEGIIANFVALTSGQTLIMAGLTFTAGSSGTTAAQLALAWTNLADGVGYVAATTAWEAAAVAAGYATTTASAGTTLGTFTAGTFTGFNTFNYYTSSIDYLEAFNPNVTLIDPSTGVPTTNAVTTAVDFRATAYLTSTALTPTGTGTAPTLNTTVTGAARNMITGVTLYDVDASAFDVDTVIYTEASFWADALVWAVNATTDYILDSLGNQIACSNYNTGVYGADAATTVRLMKQFVEQSEFANLGFITAGDQTGGTSYYV